MKERPTLKSNFCLIILGLLIVGCGENVVETDIQLVNLGPVIDKINAYPTIFTAGGLAFISVDVDEENDSLNYQWVVSDGIIDGAGPAIVWYLPATIGIETVSISITDSLGRVYN